MRERSHVACVPGCVNCNSVLWLQYAVLVMLLRATPHLQATSNSTRVPRPTHGMLELSDVSGAVCMCVRLCMHVFMYAVCMQSAVAVVM